MEVVRNRWLKKNAWAAVLVLVGALPIAGFESGVPPEQEVKASGVARKAAFRLEGLRIREAALKRQLAALAPTGSYIVVDTARNRLYVRRRTGVLLTAVASTGSGTILDDPDRPGARWVFDTPRGEFIFLFLVVGFPKTGFFVRHATKAFRRFIAGIHHRFHDAVDANLIVGAELDLCLLCFLHEIAHFLNRL